LLYRPAVLLEPFAGGGIIGLTSVFENLVDKVHFVELDEDIAAVWRTVVDGDGPWLAERIRSFVLTSESLRMQLGTVPGSIKERAFQTILRNRTNHGGILADGSGVLKYGENGKGILSRWYPETLARRINDIDKIRDRISISCADGLLAVDEFSSRKDIAYFIDPPYTVGGKRAGKRLYRHSELDHEQLFSLCQKLSGEFLITYDNASEVRDLARKYGFEMRLIPMRNTHHAKIEELVIGRTLHWMDGFPKVHDPTNEYSV
jgi:DNA adenine methylase